MHGNTEGKVIDANIHTTEYALQSVNDTYSSKKGVAYYVKTWDKANQ